MLELRRVKEQAAFAQRIENHRVRLFDEHAVPGGAPAHLAAGVDELDERQVVFRADALIVHTECRRVVNDARAVRGGDVIVRDDVMRALLAAGLCGAFKQRFIIAAHELAAREFAHNCDALFAQHGGDEILCEDEGFAVLLRAAVGDVCVHAEADVGGQRPGRGRPGEVGSVLILAAEAHGGGSFLHVLVALRDFVRSERGAAARAVGDDLVALVKQTLFVDLFERPPFGLDVVVLIGDVGVVHIRPVAHAVAHLLPLGLIFPDGLLALLDERLHAVLFDLFLAVKAEEFFHLKLHRQAMGIPARLAQHVVALHGAVTGDDVLDGAGEDVADVRLAVCGRRPVKERVGLSAAAKLHALFKDLVFFPERERFLFAFHKVQRGRYFLVHAFTPARIIVAKLKACAPKRDAGCCAVPPGLAAQAAHSFCAVTCAHGAAY